MVLTRDHGLTHTASPCCSMLRLCRCGWCFDHYIQNQIDDLAAVHELGEQVFTADKYPNLNVMWSEAEVREKQADRQTVGR